MNDGLQGGRYNAEKDNGIHDLREWKNQVGFHWSWWWGKYRRKESKITGRLKTP